VLSNMLVSIEQHVDWITDCIQAMQRQGFDVIEPTLEAENEWVETVHRIGHTTLYPLANSFYTGPNVPGKIRKFTPYAGGVGTYRRLCDAIVANGYQGFRMSAEARGDSSEPEPSQPVQA